jgi:hypothetical protein
LLLLKLLLLLLHFTDFYHTTLFKIPIAVELSTCTREVQWSNLVCDVRYIY